MIQAAIPSHTKSPLAPNNWVNRNEVRLLKTGSLDCFEIKQGGATAVVSNFGGGQVLSFKVKIDGQEHEIFYQNSAAITDGISAYRGGTQACFPHIGPAKDGMPMHGLLRLATPQLDSSYHSERETRLVFNIDKNSIPEEHRALWPDKISIRKTITLTADSLTEKYQFYNGGETRTFPFMSHNYINLKPEGLQIREERVRRAQRRPVEVTDHLGGDIMSSSNWNELRRTLPLGKGQINTTISQAFPTGGSLLAYHKKSGFQVRISTEGMPHLRLWSAVGVEVPNLDSNSSHTGIQPTGLVKVHGMYSKDGEGKPYPTVISQTIRVKDTYYAKKYPSSGIPYEL